MTTKPKTSPYDVFNRWTGEVQFTAQIECPIDSPPSLKLGLAVRWGFANSASLDSASLDGARLDGASLDGARLDGARLDGARLDGASLDGASLIGARLDGASLVGARLDGGRLDGALIRDAKIKRLFAVAARLDGYVFYAFELEDGSIRIMAGCRWFTPAEYRKHVAAEYPDTDRAAQTLSILDHFDRMAVHFLEVDDRAPALKGEG